MIRRRSCRGKLLVLEGCAIRGIGLSLVELRVRKISVVVVSVGSGYDLV